MNNVKNPDCTKCFHRKMCKRNIEVCDFVDEHTVEIGLRFVDEYIRKIESAIIDGTKEVR